MGVTSRVMSRTTIVLISIWVLITLLIATREPPSSPKP